jgi:hypothetical protein
LKKPFLKIDSKRDVLKVCFCLALSFFALSLFLMPEESVPAFSGGATHAPKSIFGLLTELLKR